MKTLKTILATATAALLIAGCATSFKPWQLSEVKNGMNKEQIVKILGEPDSTMEKDGAEYLYYSYAEELPPSSNDLETSDEVQRRADELSQSLKESKYEVILVDGKMINYKELQN
ncbi:outer membrane protein assembly factor BamE [Pontiellaceae bacterium B1224]|nr:outer membrane protein assembly factor BamE [Pontiellaceae bacterium B1224]